MSASFPTLSRRLLHAAAAERADLVRHRERLGRERDAALAELRRLDEALRAVDRRLTVLGELTGPTAAPAAESDAHTPAPAGRAAAPTEPPRRPQPAREVLRGPSIREVAVQVLIAQPEHIDAVHYRRWYELVQDDGYDVAGKDPVALQMTKDAYRHSLEMPLDAALNFIVAKEAEMTMKQGDSWRKEGIGDFVAGDYRPGMGGHEKIKR